MKAKWLAMLAAMISLEARTASAQIKPTSRILVVTGGHAYDTAAFNAMWNSFGATYTNRTLAKGHEVFETITGWNYDILVFYNHQNPGDNLTERHKENFQALLNKGVGMFVLHHSVAAYPHFPAFEAMAGGKYRSANYYSDSLSTYKIPVNINVLAARTGHPLAQGLPASYTVNDEMYFNMTFAADNDVIFKTDFAEADGPVAWSRKAGKSRVFTTILGNGSGIFSNTNFRRMVRNGLEHILPCVEGDTRDLCDPVVSIAIPGRFRSLGERVQNGRIGQGRVFEAGVFNNRDLHPNYYRTHSVNGRQKFGLLRAPF